MSEVVMTIYRVSENTIKPMNADKAALGGLPASAFQYCEAVRAATSFGWYIFPPADFVLRFDGGEVFLKEVDGEYSVLSSLYFDDEYWSGWDAACPPDLRGIRLPFLANTSVPGFVQIWTGLFVSTIDGYSTLIRPLVNIYNNSAFDVYEAIVETDVFKPMPLFLQVKIKKTDIDIPINKTTPLFQVQPINRQSYQGVGFEDRVGFLNSPELSDIRLTAHSTARPRRPVGSYGVTTRKRAKK